ncbi:MAG: acetylornithine deacetylase [Rhodobacter sp.]|nr:acetylornithine deacetylase [Rhodobacter sp.]
MTRTLEILDRLIGFATVSADSNLGLVDYVQDFLTTRGYAVHRIADPAGEKAGLFARLGPPGAGVMLSAHSDVVPVAGQDWTREPFALTRDGGRVFGRGTTDMKGYLACVLALADRAARAGLREPLKIALSYDEEIGCVGIGHMIDHLKRTIGLPRACIVGEPTGMQVAIGHKGKAALRAACFGEAGHSALAPKFLNALHLAADFVTELRNLQDDIAANGARDPDYDIPYSTVHVGTLHGGSALNIVPDRALIDFEIRYLAEDPLDRLLTRIHACADRVTARHRAKFAAARITLDQRTAYPGLDAPREDAAFALSLAQSALTKVPFGTEAGYFAGLGIPTVVCGPGDMQGQGHKPDEYIELSQLAACDAMMDRLLVELTGTHPEAKGTRA